MKLIEHKDKDKDKGKSQYDIWLSDTCHLDINNITGIVSFQNANSTDLKEIQKLIKKYKKYD
jgi:hypothetical protein